MTPTSGAGGSVDTAAGCWTVRRRAARGGPRSVAHCPFRAGAGRAGRAGRGRGRGRVRAIRWQRGGAAGAGAQWAAGR